MSPTEILDKLLYKEFKIYTSIYVYSLQHLRKSPECKFSLKETVHCLPLEKSQTKRESIPECLLIRNRKVLGIIY